MDSLVWQGGWGNRIRLPSRLPLKFFLKRFHIIAQGVPGTGFCTDLGIVHRDILLKLMSADLQWFSAYCFLCLRVTSRFYSFQPTREVFGQIQVKLQCNLRSHHLKQGSLSSAIMLLSFRLQLWGLMINLLSLIGPLFIFLLLISVTFLFCVVFLLRCSSSLAIALWLTDMVHTDESASIFLFWPLPQCTPPANLHPEQLPNPPYKLQKQDQTNT